ncbi:MAG TPA: hypothetical protein VK278_04605 [Gaiellaceae bacterium]|nr:hypothetical protein [Gaiellaceae bacterium]
MATGTTPRNGCRSTSTPGSCKTEIYPAEVPVEGSVGFTFGRDGDADLIYADVDATRAFDYTLARTR